MNNKLKQSIEDPKECQRHYGVPMAKKLRLRLEAAETLADFWPPYSGPERCHELKGDFAGVFSMDAKQPYRLLFRSQNDSSDPSPTPLNVNTDDQHRWMAINAIILISVEDTHD